MGFLDHPRFRAVYLPFVFFTLLAGDAWRYSVSWWGFGAIVIALTATSVAIIVRSKRRSLWSWMSLPVFLVAFVVLATASIAWSYYPGASALGILTTWMTVTIAAAVAVAFSWAQILRAMGTALRIILGLSLVFEVIVSAFIRQPVLPFWVDYGTTEHLPKLLYWSRDLLFAGGKIQGIVGNSSLLAMAALLGLIVFALQFASRTVHRGVGAAWILVAIACIWLTRSATIVVAIVVLALVLGAVLLLRRTGPRASAFVYGLIVALIVGGAVLVTSFHTTILGLLGKSDDLTGRLDIWSAVIALAQERPAFGWGWVSWWVPWVAPFDSLAFEAGVRQLHAHNAWLDVWLQLGILGLVVFGLLVLSTGIRSWQLATQRERTLRTDEGRFTAISLLPLLLLVALLVQSLAESRLLIEYGLMLLTVISIKTKLGDRPAALARAR